MVIIGALGHAKEIIDVFEKNEFSEELKLFDNINQYPPSYRLFDKYSVIRDFKELEAHFQLDKNFVLGIGNLKYRKSLAQKCINLGGTLQSVISKHTIIGNHDVHFESGLNIMHYVKINNSVTIGRGSLINAGTLIHHDTRIGAYCEICPNVIITGGVSIGDETFIGSGAKILPKVQIGKNVIIGAGAVVNKDVPDFQKVKGIPAKSY